MPLKRELPATHPVSTEMPIAKKQRGPFISDLQTSEVLPGIVSEDPVASLSEYASDGSDDSVICMTPIVSILYFLS